LTDHPCEACNARPAPDATVCITCMDHLISEIASVGAYHGLAYDLDIAMAKLSKFRPSPGGRSGSDERPLMIDERASDAAGHLKAALARWARVIVDDTGAEQPSDALAGIAFWMRRRVRWLAYHHEAAKAYEEICDAVRAARIAVDRPRDRVYSGPCDCGRDLYAWPGDAWAVCRGEEHEEPLMWPVDARREWLLQQAADFVGTTSQVAAALSRHDRPVTPAVIRGHAFRGNLRPVWADSRGRALYRLGDVLNVVIPVVTCEKVAV